MSGSWESGCDARHLEKYHGLKDGFSELYPSANRNPEENKVPAYLCLKEDASQGLIKSKQVPFSEKIAGKGNYIKTNNKNLPHPTKVHASLPRG